MYDDLLNFHSLKNPMANKNRKYAILEKENAFVDISENKNTLPDNE